MKEEIIKQLDIPSFYKSELGKIGKINSNGWIENIHCPFHDEKTGSFGVNCDTGQYKCFGCDSKGSVFDFYMKKHGVNYGLALNRIAELAGINLKNRNNQFIHFKLGRPVSKYPYHDTDGSILFYVCRFDPKEFRPCTPDGVWKVKGIKDVPYFLVELIKATEVFLCEGEKDANRLRKLGFVATCKANWTGKWNRTFADYFQGKIVYILQDSDAAGTEKALDAAKFLTLAENTTVKLIPPFSEIHNYDVSDWLNEGHTAEELIDIVNKTPVWQQTPENTESQTDKNHSRQDLEKLIESTSDFDELTVDIANKITESDLPESHAEYLRKKIAKKADITLTSINKDAAKFKKVCADKSMLHLDAAMSVINGYGKENLLNHNSFCWKYDKKGIWCIMDDRELKKSIHDVASSQELTQNIVSSILDLTKTEVFKPDHRFNTNRETINCLNGELYFENGLFVLKNHYRENYSTSQIPVFYDPKADCPQFEKFLQDIFQDDPEQDIKSQLIFQMIGYCLLSTCQFEKFFILIGKGANGKSVLMNVIKELIGCKNVSAVQPSQFENRFQRAHLHLKLVNLVTEIAEGAQIADAQLKAITSGELTTAEHKMKSPFEFEPFCTCIFGTNHMPHTRDFSDALFRRAIIIEFNRTFQEHEQDKNLIDKLKEELAGILNYSLIALSDVLVHGEFTIPESTNRAKKAWRADADQVVQFVDECCHLTRNTIQSSRLFHAYQEWSTIAGVKMPLNRKNFTNRLKRMGVETVRGTGGIRLLSGIELIKVE